MSIEIKVSERVAAMPAYIFSEINKIKEAALKRGVNLLSLGIGDPDLPTPKPIVERMQKAVEKQSNHVYSPYPGTPAFRQAVSTWFKKRFHVDLDPQKEIIALVGSKEGIAHFPLAFCNPGDACLYPVPGFPMYSTTIEMAGGKAVPIPLTFDNQFLPDLGNLEELMQQHKPKLMVLNYPHNPTSAVCSVEALTKIVTLAKRYHVIIAYDNAYSELYFDKQNRPISIFEVPGAKDLAIEFQSFSKTYNMTGWRLAFAVGNETLVQTLLKVKTNIDSGPLLSVQEAAVYALENNETLTSELRAIYTERRDRMLNGLKQLDIEFIPPHATFYVWAKVPTNQTSMEFVKDLIEQQGLVVTPGIGFGKNADAFFRMALTVNSEKIDDALNRLRKHLGR